jgi:hypothetical protein
MLHRLIASSIISSLDGKLDTMEIRGFHFPDVTDTRTHIEQVREGPSAGYY